MHISKHGTPRHKSRGHLRWGCSEGNRRAFFQIPGSDPPPVNLAPWSRLKNLTWTPTHAVCGLWAGLPRGKPSTWKDCSGPRGKGRNYEQRVEGGEGKVTFDDFWAQYPRKRNKGDARKAWSQMVSNGIAEKIAQALPKACASDDWHEEGGKFIPYPASWLRGECWEDVYEVELPQSGKDRAREEQRARSAELLRAVEQQSDERGKRFLTELEERSRAQFTVVK